MRSLLGIAVGAVALSGLAACGGGEDGFRSSLRTQALANCRAGSNAAAVQQLSAIGMTVDQLCTCAIDRYMRGASLEQLKQDRNNELPPALRNATMQCMAEQVQRSGASPTGAAPVAPGSVELDRARADINSAVDQARSEVENAQAEMENAMRR